MRNKLRLQLLSPTGTYSDDVLEAIAASLPKFMNRDRERLLPAIIREWARWQIDEERTSIDPKSEIPVARKNLKKLRTSASKLSESLAELDDAAKFMLAWIAAGQPSRRDATANSELGNGYQAVERARGDLELLRVWADRAASALPKVVGRYRHVTTATTITELAEIFEFLSGERAERRVRSYKHPDKGREYGPYWDFVVAVWTPLYGSTRGLGDLMKQWATHRRQGQTNSRVIEVMRENHPEWGI